MADYRAGPPRKRGGPGFGPTPSARSIPKENTVSKKNKTGAKSKSAKSGGREKLLKAVRSEIQDRVAALENQDQDAPTAKDAGEAKARKHKAPKETKPKRVSAMDAAAQVLAGSADPMGAQAMIEAMAARGLWSSPGGKTPHATLYAAITREISTKGDASRFAKAGRGIFSVVGGAA